MKRTSKPELSSREKTPPAESVFYDFRMNTPLEQQHGNCEKSICCREPPLSCIERQLCITAVIWVEPRY